MKISYIPNILIVDDEKDMTRLLKRSLEMEFECHVTMAFSGEMALSILNQSNMVEQDIQKKHIGQSNAVQSDIAHEPFDLMLCDIRMPGMDGFQLLDYASKHYPDLTVIMITAFGSIDVAIEAIKKGAYDFISKPFEQDEILFRVRKALERSALIRENQKLIKEKSYRLGKLIGDSPAMQKVYEKIKMVAQSDVTVLITGESGTGKELTAQSLHALSLRNNHNFIPINCPTVPEHILESELFGYKKGAFTNAIRDKKGLFQEADKGTIFLDEIGDISPSVQTKLLRVLQEKEIRPLGDNHTVKVDVRIIASTNKNLSQKIANGEFREDFFYRLNVFTIELPPLRERITDIPAIANHLIAKHCQKLNKPEITISPDLMTCLMRYHWPGNIRELENTLIQGILYCNSNTITEEDIHLEGVDIFKESRESQPCNSTVTPSNFAVTESNESYIEQSINELLKLPYKEAKERALNIFNHNYIGAMLKLNHGNVTQAAKMCNLERQALQQIIRRFDISVDEFR
ncbi:MAG: sigma-54-dependent Fis family transcriptional regulator [Desulfamplus sp.]|nr:sigma-54-dependent Fis family transcriptional regulator [Desulfamplus sp.]